MTCHAELDLGDESSVVGAGALLCVNCGTEFKTMILLARHELKCKSQMKPFKCEDCQKKFTTGRALLHHKRTKHERGKPTELNGPKREKRHKMEQPNDLEIPDPDKKSASRQLSMNIDDMSSQSSDEDVQEFSDSLVGSDTSLNHFLCYRALCWSRGTQSVEQTRRPPRMGI